MTNQLLPLLAVQIPSGELLLIILFGASLPVTFFIWLKWWLSSVQVGNPDQEIADQAKADREHLEHHGHPGHGAAEGSDHGHAHSHHGAHA